MSAVSESISEPADSAVGRLNYELIVTRAGQPVAGEEIVVRLEGDGSLAPSFSSKEIRRETDAEGRALITWYRRGIYGRRVRATITAEAPGDGPNLALEPITGERAEQLAGPRISNVPHRWRF
jgi:hypothetical protein